MHRSFCISLIIAWLLLLASPAWAASPTSATEDEKKAAQKMFEAGDGLYESGRYEDAVAAFKNSHDLVASPNSRLMLARSLREAGRNDEAGEEFRGTIRDAETSGGRYPEALQAAQSELQALEGLLGRVELSATLRAQLAELQINGRTVPSSVSPVSVIAGTVNITYRLKDGTSQSSKLEIGKGETKLLDLQPKGTPPSANPMPPPQPVTATVAPTSGSHPLRTAAWVSAGVGVVGLGAFGVFGYLNRKAYDDLQTSCPNNQCPASSMGKVDDGRSYQLLANVGLGVAVLGAAAATTLFVLSPSKT